ncbi:MAG: hypothetical protein IKN72_08465 [Clostridia bacterium]|nr:hypothetical protein [Clostridia bacterium]
MSRAIAGVIEVGGVPLLEKLGFDRAVFRLLEQLGLKYDLLFTDGLYSKLLIGLFILVFDYLMAKLVVFRKAKQQGKETAIPEETQNGEPETESAGTDH